MAAWSDHATCYHWLHDRAENKFYKKALALTLPIIIISTINGGLSIGTQSLFDTEQLRKYASYAIGGVSILAGLLTTIANQLRYPQKEEAHRVASISWGKFQRLIAIELALHPNDRTDALEFMKVCRVELDRLIEQSPPIPQDIIYKFEEKFGHLTDLKKPDVCGALEHTTIFESSEERLKQLSVETALAIKRKKEAIADLIAPEVQENLRHHVSLEIQSALDAEKERIRQSMEDEKKAEEDKRMELEQMKEERRKVIQQELEQWGVASHRGQRAGSTPSMEMKRRASIDSMAHLTKSVSNGHFSPSLGPSSISEPPPPPMENLVINPLYAAIGNTVTLPDRTAILETAHRSPPPIRPPHPMRPMPLPSTSTASLHTAAPSSPPLPPRRALSPAMRAPSPAMRRAPSPAMSTIVEKR